MELTYKKAIYIVTAVLFAVGLYFIWAPRDMNMYYYYNLMDQNSDSNKKIIDEGEVKVDASTLQECRGGGVGFSSEECYKKFYEKYTLKNGPEMAFKHLHAMIEHDATLIPGCHYVTHGIGAGAYYYFNKDLTEAFNFDVSKYFSNVGACGNGYYHGVSIGLTKEVNNDEDLYKILKGFCKIKEHQGKMGEESCDHGIGHAITLYYDHRLPESTAMCARLHEGDEEGRFGCMTGLRMQYGMYIDLLGLWTEKGAKGITDLCSIYPIGSSDSEACVVEGSGVVRYGENYIGAMEDCQTLEGIIERKACSKLTVIHSVRLGRSEQAKKLCFIPKTRGERVECMSFYARYLALALDADRGPLYWKTNNDVCHTMNIVDYLKCMSLIYEKTNSFRSNKYYGEFVNWADLKAYFTKGRYIKYPCENCGEYIPAMVIN